MISRIVAGAAILGCLASQAPAASLVKNGSFEKPVVPDGGGRFFSPTVRFRGWKVVGSGGNVGVNSGNLVYCNHHFPARKGKQWLDLTGNTDNGSAVGVQQAISTTPGATYELTLYVGNVVDTGGVCGTTSTVSVEIDNVPVASFTNKRNSGDTQDWRKFSMQFVAAGSRTTIALLNADPAGDFDNGLDDVSVSLVSP
jgi:hypothetical protein